MTICIGALCDKGDSAVLIADKMITNTSCFDYQIEDETIKIHCIREDCYVMDSNNVQTAQRVVQKARALTDSKSGLDAVVKAFDAVRLEKIDELFVKTRGFTLDEYKKGEIPSSILQSIEKEFKEYKLDVSFLILYWDNSDLKYKLYLLEHKTSLNEYTQLGMCCIGNQFQIAEFLILDMQYKNDLTIESLKPILVSIKTKLQVFPGIGKTHDIVCLSKGTVVESTIVK